MKTRSPFTRVRDTRVREIKNEVPIPHGFVLAL